ncbi:MAG: O-antigen ligase family protein [Thermoleophilales bacterium]|nr:O-antigen ligase family protein [Thermoleophilales bacterium]
MPDSRSGIWTSVLQFALPFILVVYLGLKAGGYDIGIRSEVGIIVIWLALLGVACGLLPVSRVTRAGWVGVGLLGGLALFVGLGALTWTESTERSMIEFSRVLMLLGTFVLVLLIQTRDGVERTVTGVAAGVTVIGIVALASRFDPDLFNVPVLPEGFSTSRLSYPLEYWNGLAALMAVGLGPLAWGAGAARDLLTRALSAAAIPLVLSVIYLSASRGGAIAAAASMVVLLVLVPGRIKVLLGLVVPGIATLIMFNFLNDRQELRDGNLGPIATSQGSEMITIAVIVVLLVGLIQALIAWGLERDGGFLPEVSRDTTQIVGAIAGVLALVVVVVALGSGFVGDKWNEFKQPQESGSTVERFGNLNSGARYEVWKSAWNASKEEPVTGIGPGTFEFWWARDGGDIQFMRDAHSLYLEFLAETGPLGFLLILFVIFGPIAFAAVRALGNGEARRRAPIAAAAAGMTGFAVAAGVDWAWEMTVLPVAFMALAASTLGPAAGSRANRDSSRFKADPWRWYARAAFGVASAITLVVIFLPYQGDRLVRESQASYREGDLVKALDQANDALDVQPYSATASVQKAQLLSELGRNELAIEAAQKATRDEPFNWQNWFVLGETFAIAGLDDKAQLAMQRAQELNPNSPIFADQGSPAVG